MMRLDAEYPKMMLVKEESALWAKVRSRYAHKKLTEEQWDRLHDKIIKKLFRQEKLIVV